MIDKVVADIPSADKVLRQLLVQRNFSRADFKLKWRRAESGGNWHYSDQFKMEGGFVGHWSNRKADRVSVPSVIQLNLHCTPSIRAKQCSWPLCWQSPRIY
jgi:hypothetical protein